MMAHHSVMLSSLRFKNCIFCDLSSDFDYSSKTDIVFRDVIHHIIDQSEPRRPKGASGGHEVSAMYAAQADEARLYL